MEKRINLASNESTSPCVAALEPQDPSLLSYRLVRIGRFVGASSEHTFVFTSNGAEAICQVLWSLFFTRAKEQGKTHFITTLAEDAPTMQMMKRLEEMGCFVKIAQLLPDGTVDLKALRALISPRTALISITMAQGLTGVIQPVEEIVRLAKEQNVLVHIDGTHTAGKYDFSLQEIGADYFTFAGDRLHATGGSGGLFAKKTAPLVPLILGGKNLRGGSSDPAAILSLCAATDQATLFFDVMALETARLRSFFERELLRLIPGAQVLFKKSLRLPNTTVISFPNVHQEALWTLLQRKKIDALIGGGEMQHLYAQLTACQIDPLVALSSLSFSFSRMTTEEELSQAIGHIHDCVLALQQISPPTQLPIFEPLTYGIPLGKKCKEWPKFAGHFSSAPDGMRLVSAQEKNVHLHVLVDTSDGVIADVKFQAFGPFALLSASELCAQLMIRKTIRQCARISADLLDQHGRDKKETPAFPKEAHGILNQIISAIDTICSLCQDIICVETDFDTTPIAWDEGETNGLADWDTFPLAKKRELIETVIAKEIRPYVELDAGGITVVDLTETNHLMISYQGACTTCHSSTGSTLFAIQKILRARLSPAISVIPV